jgi:ribosomal protein S18 acetylase RimI-like enzyme
VNAVEIRPLTPADAGRCDAIVTGLPYHFGTEEGRRECAAAVRRDAGLVALEGGEVVGFLTYVRRFDEAAEITWMAVRADRRRHGIGHALIDRLAERLAAEERRVLLVLTVSPSDAGDEPDDGYQSTRAFYRSAGFVLGRDLPREWEGDTAVVLVKSLRPPVAPRLRRTASPAPPSPGPADTGR